MVSHSVIQWLDDQIIQTGSWPFIKHSSIQEQVNMHAYLHRWLSHTKAAKIVLLDKQENKEIYPSKSLKTQSNAYEYLHSVMYAEIIDNYCCLCSVSCTGYVSCYIKVFNAFSVLFSIFFFFVYTKHILLAEQWKQGEKIFLFYLCWLCLELEWLIQTYLLHEACGLCW